MALFELSEILGILVVTIVVGYIFSGMIQRRHKDWQHYIPGFDFEDLKFSMLIAAPAVILHELGHKFVALALGVPAFFQVYWGGLVLALVLKMIGSPLLILAPAYVVTPSAIPDFSRFLITFSGPLMNLVLWGISKYALTLKMRPRYQWGFALSQKINLFLFVFNMIPIPPLDGFSVARSLFAIFSSF